MQELNRQDTHDFDVRTLFVNLEYTKYIFERLVFVINTLMTVV